MFWMIVIAIVVVIVIVLGSMKKDKTIKNNALYENKRPLTDVEQVAYWKIKEAIEPNKVVLAQVAFSSFIKTSGEKKDANVKFNKARQKVADFVVCNKDFSIYAIIEIDDKTHNKDKDEARDAITKEAGIKTLRFQAKNLPTTEQLKELLK